jgi:dipeptidyl-peptidase 4
MPRWHRAQLRSKYLQRVRNFVYRSNFTESNEITVFARQFFTFAVCCNFISWAPLTLKAQAPAVIDGTWQAATQERLKSIYERGEFRPKRFPAEWLRDSSGYLVEEVDAQTQQTVKVLYDVQTGQRSDRKLAKEEQPTRNPMASPDGNSTLEFREEGLMVRDRATDVRTLLIPKTPDRDVHIRNPIWSPDGSRVLFVESDYSDVRERAVLVPSDPSYPGIENHRFARVGEKIETLRVGVVDSQGKRIQWLPIESPDEGFYLGQVEWAGNSDEVLVEQFSRFRDRRDFLLCSVDGTVNRIYRETNEAWAESSQGKNSGLVWLDGGKSFIVVSEKDGWRHAFLYSREGKELSLLTPGNYDVIDRSVVDEGQGWYYFYASPANGTQKYLYRVPLDGKGTLERLTPDDQPGTHAYDFSPDAKWAFHTYSAIDMPPRVELVEVANHRVVRVLEENLRLQEKMQEIGARPTEFVQITIADDISMDAWMLKPKDFDASKKYPVFIYVYGEPHAQTVLDEWGAGHVDFHRVVADLGYLVVSIDNRGTPAPKGAAWRRSIFGSLGPLSTEEQEAGIKELGRMRSYVDLSRVGIWGWSGGGSNTLNAMFRKPDSYHVGIAVVPKPQPHLYNAWFQEIFMRTREVNPDGYERAAAINFADGLKNKLLIITGSGETNTHIQIIEGLIDKLVELGKPFDYMVYPNRDHGLREGNGTVVHVRMLIIRYLMQHLPAGPR